MIAFCGIVCTDCPGYLATREDSDDKRRSVAELWSEQFRTAIRPEDVNCDGCLEHGGRLFRLSLGCKVRECGRARMLANCAHCGEYPCQRLGFVLDAVPAARDTLEKVRRSIGKA